MQRIFALGIVLALGGCSALGLSDNSFEKSPMAPPAVEEAAATSAPTMTITEGWISPSHKRKAAAVYMTLANTGTDDDKLLSASSPRANRVEVHAMSVRHHGKRRSPMPKGVAIPAGQKVVLEQGGVYLMLKGLKGRVRAGEIIPVNLTFEKAGTIEANFTVTSRVAAH